MCILMMFLGWFLVVVLVVVSVVFLVLVFVQVSVFVSVVQVNIGCGWLVMLLWLMSDLFVVDDIIVDVQV